MVVVLRAAPVATAVTVTLAPGITPPPWSTTRPLNVPVPWPKAKLAARITNPKIQMILIVDSLIFVNDPSCRGRAIPLSFTLRNHQ